MKVPVLSEIPTPVLAVFALVMGLAPFTPEPHLFGKVRMLLQGSLDRPLDLFDLVFHLVPTLLLAIKLLSDSPGKSAP